MLDLIIKNGTCFIDGNLEKKDIGITEGKISKIDQSINDTSKEIIDSKNLLIAINGVDSSALNGYATKLEPNDVVNIIPIIHGGSKTNLSFKINNYHIGLFEINKSNSNKDYLLILRTKFPKLKLQAILKTLIRIKSKEYEFVTTDQI